MEILVISNSLVIQELFKLVLKNKNAKVQYAQKAQDANSINYDIVFIDDYIPNLKEQIDFIKTHLRAKNITLLGGDDLELASLVDIVLKKPFLPSDIEEILQKFDNKELSTHILDPNEIAKIRALMDIDEDKKQEDLSYIERLENKEPLKLKKKAAKEFLLEILDLDKKELKSLLKGAKVSIKIKFKDSNE